MRRQHLALVAAVPALAALVTPCAQAKKFPVRLAFEPAPPAARSPVRATMRIGAALPREQRYRLVAVGPWRGERGQAVLQVRLVRTGPRAFTARFRFPYAGRWRLNALPVSGQSAAQLPLVGAWTVRVRRN